MKNLAITILIILAATAFIGYFVFYQSKSVAQNAPVNNETSENRQLPVSNAQTWQTKTDEQANVSVAVTPIDLSPQSSQWKFDVSMNTHSIELDQDMIKSSVLIDSDGAEYKPVEWQGPTGGHHLEGMLIFNKIVSAPKQIKLKIVGVAGTVRIFTW